MFERGNPYKYTDPEGHFLQLAVGVIIIAIVVVAVAKWGMNLYEAGDDIDARIDAHVEAIGDLSTPVAEGLKPGGILIKESLDAKTALDMKNKLSDMDDDDDEDDITGDKKTKEPGQIDTYVIQQNQASDANPAQNNQQSSSSQSNGPSSSDNGGIDYNSGWGGSWLNSFVKSVITWAQKVAGGGNSGSSDGDSDDE